MSISIGRNDQLDLIEQIASILRSSGEWVPAETIADELRNRHARLIETADLRTLLASTGSMFESNGNDEWQLRAMARAFDESARINGFCMDRRPRLNWVASRVNFAPDSVTIKSCEPEYSDDGKPLKYSFKIKINVQGRDALRGKPVNEDMVHSLSWIADRWVGTFGVGAVGE